MPIGADIISCALARDIKVLLEPSLLVLQSLNDALGPQ